MKIKILIFVLAGMTACKKSEVATVSEQISKVWYAQSVKNNSTTVYTKGGNNIKPDYDYYKLILNATGYVELNEYDGSKFAGKWNLSNNDKTLTLNELMPQPTGSGGTLQYDIISVSDKSLVLILKSSSLKTGGSINEYQLVTQ